MTRDIPPIKAGPLDLLPASVQHLDALLGAADTFEREFGVSVAPAYLDSPNVLAICREALVLDPSRLAWWCHLAILRRERRLVGFGGYKGVPTHGAVEIGYQIAPAFRGRGLATAFASGLVANAWREPTVRTIIAHTAPESSASTHILTKLGFTCVGDAEDARFPGGQAWLWELARTD
jgi:GNAT superfamily N-acetyltransferase